MKLCEHLEPILANETDYGNSIGDIIENAWTNAKLVVILKNAINVNQTNTIVSSPFVKYFEITDNHYELQKGYFCEQCKHAIASPI